MAPIRIGINNRGVDRLFRSNRQRKTSGVLDYVSLNGGWYNFRELVAGGDFVSLLDKTGKYTAIPTTNAPNIESKFGVNALRFTASSLEGVNLGTDMQPMYDYNSFSLLFTIAPVDPTPATNDYIAGFNNTTLGVANQIYLANTSGLGLMRFNVDNGATSRSSNTDLQAFGTTNFHTVIITFDVVANKPTCWIDGIKVPQTAQGNVQEFNTVTTGLNWFLGLRNNNGVEDLPFDGWITDFMFTEGVWTDAEIAELINYFN